MPDWNLRLRRLAAVLLLGDAVLRLRSSWLRARRETTAELWTRQNLDRIMDTAVVAVVERYDEADGAAAHALGAFEAEVHGDIADAAREAVARWAAKHDQRPRFLRSFAAMTEEDQAGFVEDLLEHWDRTPVADAVMPESALWPHVTGEPQTTKQAWARYNAEWLASSDSAAGLKFDLEWARQQVRERHTIDFPPRPDTGNPVRDALADFHVARGPIDYPMLHPLPHRIVDWVGVLLVFDRDSTDARHVVGPDNRERPDRSDDQHTGPALGPLSALPVLLPTPGWDGYQAREALGVIHHLWFDVLPDRHGEDTHVLCGAGNFDLADLAAINLPTAHALWSGRNTAVAAHVVDSLVQQVGDVLLVKSWRFAGATLAPEPVWPECRIWIPGAPLPKQDDSTTDTTVPSTQDDDTDRSA